MDNKNEISNYESNESNHNSSQGCKLVKNFLRLNFNFFLKTARKFRIATDWSDTGPTSMPINETIDNNGKKI
jgi:hypothetical protein